LYTEAQIQEELARRVPKPVREGLVWAIRDSYRTVKTRYHVPEDGHNKITFGNQIWQFICKRIADYVRGEGAAHGLSRHASKHLFWLVSDGIILAAYRLPEGNGTWDESFPHNNNGAGQLTELNLRSQTELFEELDEPTGVPAGLVVAHSGNPEEACTGVYLMEPVAAREGRITTWRYTEALWLKDQDIGGLPQPKLIVPPPLPPRELPATQEDGR
jgi:hypothetical protein